MSERKANTLLILAFIAVFVPLFAYFIWPGPWDYMEPHQRVRTNRLTGRVEFYDPTRGWVALRPEQEASPLLAPRAQDAHSDPGVIEWSDAVRKHQEEIERREAERNAGR